MQAITNARKRITTAALTLALIAAAGTSLAAPFTASPAAANELPSDDQLTVAERSHVDSPKVFYDEQEGFTLKSEFGRTTHPLEQTINYAERAYDRNGKQYYHFQVPEDAPELDFLRETGEHWYMTPTVNPLDLVQIWSGYGADTDIPVEKFRDATFSLDLVHANGPGRAELFVWAEGEDGTRGHVDRLLSTRDIAHRSVPLTPGNHTHNYTLFSAPGRYELTYRVTARGTDGTLIASRDTVLQWQVGGNRPGAAMDSESATASAEKFAVTPVPDSHKQANVPLHQLQLALDEPVDGTAEFTINGFHLATVQLRDGRAAFTELLGASDANYQVTARDASGKVRFVSAPLEVGPGGSAATSAAGEVTAPQAVESPALSADEITLDGDITAKVTVTAIEGDARRIDVDFSKPGFVGFVELSNHPEAGGSYSEITTLLNATGEQHLSTIAAYDSYTEGYQLKATLRPHPLVRNANAAVITLTDAYQSGTAVSGTGAIKVTDAGSAPAPTETAPDASPSESPAPDAGQRVVISSGHLDLAATPVDDGVDLLVKDDTRQHAAKTVDRPVDSVAIAVPDYLRQERRGDAADAKWDAVLAPAPKPSYVLPFTQRDGAAWPGYSSDRFNYEEIAGPVTLELVDFDGPGRMALFESGNLGDAPKIVLGSAADAPKRIDMAQPTHAHAGWAFTEPGTYELTLRSTVQLADGTAARSPEHTLVVLVGDAAIDGAMKGQQDGGGVAQPTSEPSASPSAPPSAGETAPAGTEPAGTGPAGGGATDTEPADDAVPSGTVPAGASGGDAVTQPAASSAPVMAHAADANPAALARTGASNWEAFAAAAALALIGGAALTVRRRRIH